MAVGVSYGGGQKHPGNLQNGELSNAAQRLMVHRGMERLASFANSTFHFIFSHCAVLTVFSPASFAMWAPKLHAEYVEKLCALYASEREKGRETRPNWDKCVLPCTTINFGPDVCTFIHRDWKNLPYGWCGIQVGGDFDATKGGHLILWDLKITIEFPVGSLIFIPSATLAHSNVPIQKGETRVSVTHYAAGGLFHWVDNEFRNDEDFAKDFPERAKEKQEQKNQRWKEGLSKYSTVKELLQGP